MSIDALAESLERTLPFTAPEEVRGKILDALRAAVAMEREACAQICEEHAQSLRDIDEHGASRSCAACAADIRARST